MKTDTGIQIIRMSQRMMSNQSGSASIGELCSSNDQCSIFSKTSVSVSDYQYFSTWIIDDVGKSIIIIPVQYELLQAPLYYSCYLIPFPFLNWLESWRLVPRVHWRVSRRELYTKVIRAPIFFLVSPCCWLAEPCSDVGHPTTTKRTRETC